MATYKVIQDIEAEDKFLGPLTIKQFIFGIGGAFFGYLNIFAIQQGFPYAMIILVPPMLLGFFLAVPWSKDQPTEVWVLAKLRFYFKPRKKIWDQTGMEELVTITAPKKEEKQLTKGFSQTEVKSRLEALAQTIDSRGWAIKDIGGIPSLQQVGSSDRLISPASLPQEVPLIDTDSIPDPYTAETATSANFDRMMQESTDLRKAQNLEKMDRIRSGEPLENIVMPEIHFTPPSVTENLPIEAPSIDEKALSQELKSRSAPNKLPTARMHTITPAQLSQIPDDTTTDNTVSASNDVTDEDEIKDQNSDSPSNPQASPVILDYAGNNDLNIATIARQAKKDTEGDAGEVVVSLH